ncbi:hypothetical protein U1Q18_008647 [Sarracenia purpurea var. burkii]
MHLRLLLLILSLMFYGLTGQSRGDNELQNALLTVVNWSMCRCLLHCLSSKNIELTFENVLQHVMQPGGVAYASDPALQLQQVLLGYIYSSLCCMSLLRFDGSCWVPLPKRKRSRRSGVVSFCVVSFVCNFWFSVVNWLWFGRGLQMLVQVFFGFLFGGFLVVFWWLPSLVQGVCALALLLRLGVLAFFCFLVMLAPFPLWSKPWVAGCFLCLALQVVHSF